MSATSRYLTVSEASAITRLARQTLYKMVCQRSIPFTKAGGRLLFREDKLLAWLEANAFSPEDRGKGHFSDVDRQQSVSSFRARTHEQA